MTMKLPLALTCPGIDPTNPFNSLHGDQRNARAFLRFSMRSTLAASLVAGGGLATVAFMMDSIAEDSWRNTLMIAGALTPLTAMLLLSAGQLRGLGAVEFSQVPAAVIRPFGIKSITGAFWAVGDQAHRKRGIDEAEHLGNQHESMSARH